MTPSMNMGMKGPQQSGLASIAQPATQPRGKSPESIAEIMALAKKLSDGELADILAGKSMAIPQYVAITEAMGRRNLREAVKGAQAMAQAKQPSIKDKFLMSEMADQMPQMPVMAQPQMPQLVQPPRMAAEGGLMYEEGGLASLPAPNMNTVDMASGGIIAFSGENESLVQEREPVFGSPEYNEKYGEPGSLKRKWKSIKDYYASPSTSGGVARNIANTANAIAPMSFGAGVTGGQFIPKTGQIGTTIADQARKLFGLEGYFNALGSGSKVDAPPVVPADAKSDNPPPPAGDPNKQGNQKPSGGLTDLGMPSYDELLKRRTTDFLAELKDVGDKKSARAGKVNEGLKSQLLLDASSALLGSRNISEAGGKFGTKASERMGAARAEQNALEDAADQYRFNFAKAREAAEKGDMQLAMQYAQLANQNKYQMGMLDVYKERNAIMGEAGTLGKVSLALNQADKQALAEAKQKYPVITKANQAAYDMFLRKRARELKLGNPLTKQYADLSGSDLGGGAFNVVQSPGKGASVYDPTEG